MCRKCRKGIQVEHATTSQFCYCNVDLLFEPLIYCQQHDLGSTSCIAKSSACYRPLTCGKCVRETARITHSGLYKGDRQFSWRHIHIVRRVFFTCFGILVGALLCMPLVLVLIYTFFLFGWTCYFKDLSVCFKRPQNDTYVCSLQSNDSAND